MCTFARCSWVLLAGFTCAVACGYPDYDFVDVVGTGGSAGSTAGLGGTASDGGTAGSSGTSGGGSSGGGSGGVSGNGGTIITGEGGAAGVPVSGGGGAGGTDDECLEMGEGGSGGAAAPYVCADYEFFPPGCTCADYQGHAYFFCGVYRNFENANTYCGYDGMQLAHVESSQENGWIRATAMARVPPLEYYWLGGTSDGTPDSWRWVDGTPFWSGNTPGEPVCGRFANWRSDAPSDPETTEPDQLCLYFTMDGWDDDVCNGDRMYVCEWY